MTRAPSEKRHLLTVTLEEYYHTGTFDRLIARERWSRFESRVEACTDRTLDLLDEFGIRATFFVLGWLADVCPELVRRVAERGHEIASKGYSHRGIRGLSPGQLEEEAVRSREALEGATGRAVRGFRIGHGWFGPTDLWALDVVAASGYEYDSSIGPLFRRFSAEPWRRFAHQHRSPGRVLWEFPISSASILGWHVPIAGANYFRQFPHALMRRLVARWDRTYTSPFVMYFHTWELDPEQPRISAAPLHARIRHYRNLDKMSAILRHYFIHYRFSPIADYLSTAPAVAAAPAPERERVILVREVAPPDPVLVGAATPRAASGAASSRTPVSIVVPCYNEELTLPYLANTLESVERELVSEYDVHFVFVDDGSADGTWGALQRVFGAKANVTLLRHERNRGVTAGVLTGIRHATTEVVCSIDCDCTYDPHELRKMIPLLDAGVDLVVASPYHPDGRVLNVPGWRLSLSRSASWLYRHLLKQPVHTYTSVCRVYRRSAVLGVRVEREDFLGIAELLGRLMLRGARVAEYPATLEVRILGHSKMKVVPTIFGHLRLLAELSVLRLRGAGRQDVGRDETPHRPLTPLEVHPPPSVTSTAAPHSRPERSHV